MNLLDLFVRIGVRDDASGQIESVASSLTNTLAGAARFAAKAMAAVWAVKKVADFGKQAYSAYASFEQLAGGVAKLYGNAGMSLKEYAESAGKSVDEVSEAWHRNEEAQRLMMENAQKGWQTAGLDANSYMEQATSFSAALINSLGGDTVEAAKLTDVAMRAMSDNINTFGTDAQSVQNAFQGFAKQNYTMLDNLKLGYGGTKTEMQRLIDDANKWGAENGKASDLSIEKFSDVVTAIQQIQEAQGIAGTTQKEALYTVEGSANAARAAWQNLIAEIGKPDADMEGRINDLMNSVFGMVNEKTGEREGGLLSNASATISRVASGITQALPTLASTVAEIVPEAVNNVLSLLPDEISNKVETIYNGVSELVTGVSEKIDFEAISERLEGALGTIEHIFDHVTEKIDVETIVERVGQVFDGIGGFIDSFSSTVDWGNINVIIDSLMNVADTAWGFVEENILPNLPVLGEAVGNVANFLMELATAVLNVVNAVAPFLPAIIGAVVAVKGFMIVQTIIGFLSGLGGVISTVATFVSTFGGVLGTVAAALGGWPVLLVAVIGAIVGFIATNEDARKAIGKAWDAIKETVGKVASAVGEFVGNAVDDLKEGIDNFVENLSGIFDAVMGFFGEVGDFISDPIGAIQNGLSDVSSSFDGLASSTGTSMAKVNKAVDGSEKKVKEYSGTPLGDKNATATVKGNVIDGSAKSATKETKDTVDSLKGKTVDAKVKGNAVDGSAKKNVENTSGAISKMKGSTVEAKVRGNAVDGSAKTQIDKLIGSISSMRSKDIRLTTYQTTVKSTVNGPTRQERAWGGIRRHARGDIMVANNPGPGIPLDVVGEAGPEAIVPLTSHYGKDFAEMMGREAARVMGAGGKPAVNIYLTYNAGEDATKLVNDIARGLELVL